MWVWIHHDLALFHPVTSTTQSDQRIYSDLWADDRSDRALNEPPDADEPEPSADARARLSLGADAVDVLDDLRHPHLHLQ